MRQLSCLASPDTPCSVEVTVRFKLVSTWGARLTARPADSSGGAASSGQQWQSTTLFLFYLASHQPAVEISHLFQLLGKKTTIIFKPPNCHVRLNMGITYCDAGSFKSYIQIMQGEGQMCKFCANLNNFKASRPVPMLNQDQPFQPCHCVNHYLFRSFSPNSSGFTRTAGDNFESESDEESERLSPLPTKRVRVSDINITR